MAASQETTEAAATASSVPTGHTELFALIASPIRHSHSPRMHNLALRKLGIDAVYLAFEVEEHSLAAAVGGMRALGVRGFNVSMPNKVSILGHMDAVDLSVELTGACNTVVDEAGVLTAYNTDGVGWTSALRERGREVRGSTLTIIGAGGAAAAMAGRAAQDGAARIHLFNRRDRFFDDGARRAEYIAARTRVPVTMRDLDDARAFADAVAGSSVLANATGVGMKPLEGYSPLPDPDVLRPDLFVTDVVYSPARSAFLRQAEAAGARSMNGLPMMFHQGAASFRLFTGRQMPLEYVRERMRDLAA